MPSTRRRLLAALGSGATAGLAGCVGSLPLDTDCPDYAAPRWSIDGRYWSPPVVHDGHVLAGTYHGATGNDRARLVYTRGHDGQERWIETVEGGGFGVPRVHADTVYVGTGTDRVFALERDSGQRRWTYDAGGRERYGGGAPGQPAVVGTTVVVGVSHSARSDADPSDPDDYTHRVVGLDRGSGAERWAVEFDRQVRAGPTRDAGGVIVTTRGGTVARLDAATGAAQWTVPLDAGLDRRALRADDRVVVATTTGTVRGLDADTGDRGWRGALPGEPTDWTVTDGGIVVADATGAVTAISPDRDGEQCWQYAADAAVAGVGVRDGTVYAFDDRGVLHRLDVDDGQGLARSRHAEHGVDDGCGWAETYERATGLAVSDDSLYLAGPWLGAVVRDG